MENFNSISDDKNQLSLEQFAATNRAEAPQFKLTGQLEKAGVSFDDSAHSLYFHNPILEQEEKSSRFFALSTGLHVLLAIGMACVTVPLVENKAKEIITIEIAAPPPPPIAQAKGSATPEEIKPAKPVATSKEDAVQVRPVAAKTKVAKVKHASPKVKVAPKFAKARGGHRAAAPAPKIAARATVDRTQVYEMPDIPDAVPMNASLDDIQAQDLDDNALRNSGPGEFDSKDLTKDLEKVDKAHQKVADAEAAKLAAMADDLAAQNDKEAADLRAEQDNENARIAAANQGRRSKEMAAAAAAAAAERAAAARAGAERARRGRANGVAQGGAADGSPRGVQNGQPRGVPGGTGAPTNVRKLEELRQMPGNIRPQYSEEERLRGDQGQSVFYAYITPEGIPTQFKMQRSTGFRNLDAKTLSALKKWRFYPGQQGWVELPFHWDIRGDTKEKPTLLRRSAGL